ncbi:DUF7507 domain-containing protein [Phycicoccus avicenniae]|uniref:DUF7507 domain-containing protein n=1 Tax=Phycicoccus avicenniae TaxID=2828860 RepID=UPI003D286DBD
MRGSLLGRLLGLGPGERLPARRRLAMLLATALVVVLGGAVVLPASAQAAPPAAATTAQAPAGAGTTTGLAAAAPSATLSVSANPTSLPYGGGSVTYTYTLANNGDSRLFFQSATDTVCPAIEYVSGGSTTGVDNTRVVDAGGSLVFRCTTTVTATATSTATFTFGYGSFCPVQCDGSLTRTAQATVTVQQPLFPCTNIWYGSVGTSSTTAGSYGRIFPTATSVGNIVPPGLTGSWSTSAIAIDPTNPDFLYYTPRTSNVSGSFSNTLYRVDLNTQVQTKVADGTTGGQEFVTNRLAFDVNGRLWSFANTGLIYSWTAAGGFSAAKSPTTSNGVLFSSLQSGDIAFDGNGTMYVLAADATTTYLYRITAASLATATPSAQLVNTFAAPTVGAFYNGLAFSSDGTLYATSTNTGTATYALYKVDPDRGTVTQQTTGTNLRIVGDLASCAIPKPALRVTKTVSPSTAVRGGETLTYTVKVDNIGTLSALATAVQDAIPANTTYVRNSTTLNGTAVSDTGSAPFFPYATSTAVNSSGVNSGIVAQGASATVTFRVTVNSLTAAVRSVCNQATVTASGLSSTLSDDPGVAGSGDPTCNLAYTPGIQVTKTASPTTVNISGPVTYTYTVINNGNEPLRAVTLADDKGTVSQTHTGDTNNDNLLQIGEAWVYTLTQTLSTTTTNTATATGTGNVSGAAASDTDTATVTVTRPTLNLAKTAGAVTGPAGDGTYRATYTVTVGNTGNGAGTYGPITDTPAFAANLQPTGASWSGQATGSATGAGPYSIGAAGTSIAAGATHTYTVVVTFRYTNGTQAVACAGTGTGLYNGATLPAGQEAGGTTDNAACATPPAPPAPGLTLTKTAGALQDLDGNGADAGDRIVFSFVVRNSGNVDLDTVALSDAKVGLPALTCPATTLAVGASMTCTAVSYTVTQADVDAGAVANTATVRGNAPNGVTTTATSSTSTPLPPSPRLSLTKAVAEVTDVNTNGVTDPGDRIRYTFSVTNTGNVTLGSLTVTDAKLGLSAVACTTGSLAPGATATCTTSPVYTVTSADVTAGAVTNSATASASPVSGGSVTSNTSSTSTPVASAASLDVVKTAGSLSALDPETGRYTATYTVQVVNSGQTPTTYGALTDTASFGPGIAVEGASWTGPTTGTSSTTGPYTLAPAGTSVGGTTTQTWTVTVRLHMTRTTPSTACAGPGSGLYNAASLPAGQEAGSTANNAACLAPPTPPAPSIDLVKTVQGVQDVNGNGLTDAGDRITWAFTVRNTGTIALAGASVSDPRLAAAGITITCADPALSVGESTACTVSGPYTITAADVTAGAVANTATATGTPPFLPAVTDTDSTSTPTQTASLVLTKTAGAVTDANGSGRQDAGDAVAYTFSIRNTGNTALSDLRIGDARLGLGNVLCAAGPLAAGATTSCTRTYTLTQADVDAGSVTNTATATGTPPNGATPVSNTSSATVTVAPTNGLALTKTASGIADTNADGRPSAGDRITYGFSVRNTGTTTLTNVTVTDAKLGVSGAACVATLAPGATATCSTVVAYPITQADVDAGSVTNTASATATPPSGAAPTASSSTTTPVTTVAAISLTKTAGAVADTNGSGRQDAGDRVTYSFTVTNTSNVTLGNVTVTDAKLGPVTCVRTTLTPGQSTTCSAAAYVLTQADLDAGRVDNTASVSGTTPGGGTATATAAAVVTLVPAASVALVKVSEPVQDLDGNGPDVGDTVAYSFRVTNTGNQSLSTLKITDAKLGINGSACAAGPLAPGATATCVAPAPYVLTQADVDAGFVENTATVDGTAPAGPVTASDVERRALAPTSSVSLRKVAGAVTDLDGNGQDAGDTVAYSFEVTNTGATTLRDGVVIDPKLGLTAFTCAPGAIAPGQSVSCPAPREYVLTQADVDAGGVTNTASVSATTPTGGTTAVTTGTSTRPIVPTNSIALTKTAGAVVDTDDNGPDAGDTVTYTFTVRNTGGSTLDDIRLDDALLGLSGSVCAAGPLAPGATLSCPSATYTLTQADLDAGQVVNTATASATPRAGSRPTASASAVRDVDQLATLTVAKTAGPVVDANGSGRQDAGDTVSYGFRVTNTSNVTLSLVRVSDAMLGLSGEVCGTGTLAPGASTTCSGFIHTLTQQDVDAGRVQNTATASGRTPGGTTATAVATAVRDVTAPSSLSATKTAGAVVDANGSGRQDAGDTVTYTFTLQNTGASTLTAPRVTDPQVGVVDYACGTGSLAPGASATCTAPAYTLTQADLNAGRVDNTATAAATTPAGDTVSASASATRPLSAAPALELTKRASAVTDVDGNGADAGDTITYSFAVRNTGNVSLTDVRVDDAKLGLSGTLCVTGPLAPGAASDCTATRTYTLTQADVDSGAVSNTATATATGASGGTASDGSSTTTTLTTVAAVALTKTAGAVVDANADGRQSAGDTVAYTFTVRNVSTVTLSSVSVSDPRLGTVTCTATTLAPGASTTCTAAPYRLTQADLDAGTVVNTASVTASDPRGGTATAAASATVTLTPPTTLALDKSAGPVVDVDGNGVDVGDTITYSFSVTNTGSVTVTNVVVNDNKLRLTGYLCAAGPVAPGQTVGCTAPAFVLAQGDVDSARVENLATVTATTPGGGTSTPPGQDSVVTPLSPTSALLLLKTGGELRDANDDGLPSAGDEVVYTFTVTNTGATTLRDIRVTDDKLGLVDYLCSAGPVAPGASVTCQGPRPYVLTQADVDSGSIENTATATGRPQVGSTVSDSDTATTPVDQVAEIILDKAVGSVADTNGTGRVDAGDRVTFTVTVTNTAAVTLTDLAVSDPRAGAVTCVPTVLGPGEQATCTVPPVTITQAEADRGAVSNTATATALEPGGGTVTSTDTANLPIAQVDAAQLDKTAGAVLDTNTSGTVDAGDTVTYTFAVLNTGTTTLRTVLVDDARIGLSGFSCAGGGSPLTPRNTRTCTSPPYTLTQADIDAGRVDNTATIRATGSAGTATAQDDATVLLPSSGDIELTKSASTPVDIDADGRIEAGDTITYTFLLRNTSTVTLTDVTVSDPLLGLDGARCGAASLAPGATTTCTRTHVVTQAELDAGGVDNTASARALRPDGSASTDTSSARVPLPGTSQLQLTKSASGVVDGDGNGPDAGDTLEYSFSVRNLGTTSLTDVRVSDPRTGTEAVLCAAGPLAPGATVPCAATATYTLTQADVDAGAVANTATATAVPPYGTTPTATSSTLTPVDSVASISLTKSGSAPEDTDGSGSVTVGDTVRWSFTVTNTTTVTLKAVRVVDPSAGEVTCPVTTLAPGESTVCTIAGHRLDQAEVDAGRVDNTATVRAEDPRDVTVTDTDSTSVTFAPPSSLTLEKTAGPVVDTNGSGREGVGDTVTYTFSVRNTGATTLSSVTVDDARIGVTGLACGTALAPGATTSCSATYTLTQTDVDAGRVDNTATASAGTPSGGSVTDDDAASVTIRPTTSVELTKTASGVTDVDGNGPDAGDTVEYSFSVRNTGSSTLTAVTLDDPLLGLEDETCTTTPLAPFAVQPCAGTFVHVLTQAEVDAGAVRNTATATATSAAGATATDDSTATVSVDTLAALRLDKAVTGVADTNGSGRRDAGDTVTYGFTVTNTSAVTLTSVTVEDSRIGRAQSVCGTGTLAPGASTTCSSTYVLTQPDADADRVDNTAVARAATPTGGTVEDDDTASLVLGAPASVELTKTAGVVVDANGSGRQDAGDTVEYSFSVRNTGAVSLTDLRLEDPVAGLSNALCAAGPLLPGTSTPCAVRGTHVLTQGEVDAGVVDNTAVVSAAAATGGRVTDAAEASRAVDSSPLVDLAKEGSAVVDTDANGADAGDTVTWTFTVTNTGPTTLTGVTVTDPRIGVDALVCAPSLAPGQVVRCAVDYSLTQDDVDAGTVENTAGVTGTDTRGRTATDDATASVAVDALAEITLDKTAGDPTTAQGADPERVDAGDTVTYTFTVRNTSAVTLRGVTVTDPLVGSVTCPLTTLAPGGSTTCTAPAYVLTQDDLDTGVLDNRAEVAATGTNGTVRAADVATVTLPQESGIVLTKLSGGVSDTDGSGRVDAGDTIDYSFRVTNTGTTRLDPVRIDDARLDVSGLPCGSAPLEPGETRTCSGPVLVLTQADIDAGSVTNTATATGTDPGGRDVTDEDTTTTRFDGPATLSLAKSAGAVQDTNGSGRQDAGDTVTYTFTVTNTGARTLRDIAVRDELVGATALPCATGLAPGASATCSADLVLTQEDVDRGRVDNTADATATTPDGGSVSADASASVVLAPATGLDLTKTASAIRDVDGNGADAGDTITYSFTVRNTGTTRLTDVLLTDPMLGLDAVPCSAGPLQPGETVGCDTAYVHTLTQADVDAGSVANTASAAATTPTGSAPSDTSSTVTPLDRVAELRLEKAVGSIADANDSGRVDAGDTTTYTFTITNTSNVTLSTVRLTDARLGLEDEVCGAGSLAPGASTECTSDPYVLTQADVDAGRVDNSATATATGPDGSSTRADAAATLRVPTVNSMSLDKTAGTPTTDRGLDPTTTDAGDVVDYSFRVTNTGTQTLDLLTVADPRIGLTALRCVATLAPGRSVDCAGSYTLTQADIDAGGLSNTATATGFTPPGDPVRTTDGADLEVTGRNALALTKSASAVADTDGNGADAGDTIEYSFSVRNDGTTTLRDLTLTDPLLGLSAAPCASGPLAPGASIPCDRTWTYTLTQDDIDAGAVSNTATATAVPPSGTPSTASSSTTTPMTTLAELTLVKSAGDVVDTDGDGVASAGDTIAYSFTVENVSNVTVRVIQVADPNLDDIRCAAITLRPGDTTTCSAPAYVLTQADVDAGRVDNTATAVGLDPQDVETTATDTVTTRLRTSGSLRMAKTAGDVVDANGSGRIDAGDTVTYGFAVTNTGSTNLSDVSVDDARLGVQGLRCGSGALRPGATVPCPPAVHELTQADIDAGEVLNTATAAGRTPSGDPVTDDDSATVRFSGPSSVRLDKSVSEVVDVDADGRADEGDRLAYTFVVTNTGTMTLTDPVIDDPLLVLDGFACAPGVLAPGASATCEAPRPYTLTAADVDAGVVENTATVSAGTPAGGSVIDEDSASAPLDRVAQVRIVKTAGDVADANDSGRVDAGDTVAFTLRVENTSNVTLTDIAVSDPLLGAVTCPTSTLAAEATTTCSAGVHTLTQADVDAGRVDNTARVTATSPVSVVSDEDSVRVPLTGAASISLTKTAGPVVDVDANGPDAGDTVTWTLEVTNTGTVTLDSVLVDDELLALTEFACGSGPLAPGASRTCVLPTYALTQDDVDAGAVTNSATVAGTPPTGDPVTDTDSASATLTPGGALTLDKQVVGIADTDDSGRDDAGDTVTYRFTATNTGATTVTGLVLDDPRLGLAGVRCGDATLAPGASTTCERPYVLTQADVDAGRADNEAAVRGTDSRGAAVRAEDGATVTFVPTTAVELTKTASGVRDSNGDGRVSAGDEVEFAFSVRNAGDVSLRDLVVDDARLGVDGLPCAAGPLAPGDTAVCATTVSYVLTASDLDAGAVLNTATVTATPSTGGTVTDDASAVVPLDRLAGLELTKTAGPVVDANQSGRLDAGDTVAYALSVRNVGTTTLRGVAVTDPLLGDVTCPTGPLAAGASTTCTADPYVLTQTDLDAGRVDNTATASATDPDGEPTSDLGTAVVELDAAPGIALAKSAGAVVDANDDGRVDAGDRITYTFRVTNTGTTTLGGVTVDDDRLGLTGLACGTGPLAPGETRSCTAGYVLTQADLDAGSVTNTATATGTDPAGRDVTGEGSTTTRFDGAAALGLTKTAGSVQDTNDSGRQDAGDTVTYTFTVTNTGARTLRDVAVRDELVGATALPCAATLAPGASASCTADVVLTQEDVDRGRVDNFADATATTPSGTTVSADDSASVVLTPATGLDLTKTASAIRDVDGNGADAGDTITYSFTARNTGTTRLTDVRLTDAMLGLDAVLCSAGPLQPGETVGCDTAYVHVLTQADVDAGSVANTASATATTPTGAAPSDTSSTVTPLDRVAQLRLEKTVGAIVDANDSGRVDAGDTATYTFAITNTSNVTLGSVRLTDARLGLEDVVCGDGTLAPGATTECTSDPYVLTQTDVDAGRVDNAATATATGPGGVSTRADATASLRVPVTDSMTLQKTAGTPTTDRGTDPATTDAGDVVEYGFRVTNTGTQTLDLLTVADPRIGLTALRCVATLAPGESVDCAGSYTLTQADVDAGGFSNTATATGFTPAGDPVSATDDADLVLAGRNALALTKTASAIADTDGNGADAGDTIEYSFSVRNDGTTTLRDLTVTDPLLGLVAAPCATGPLAPGASVPCDRTWTYTLTQDDVDAGAVRNTATATAVPPSGTAPTGSSSTTTPMTAVARLTLVKTAGDVVDVDDDGVASAGDTIAYAFTVRNVSTVTVRAIRVTDPNLQDVQCDAVTLRPGGTTTCSAPAYVLTQADVDAGRVDNTATVVGLDPQDVETTATDTVTTPLATSGSLRLAKTAGDVVDANGSGRVDAGDTVAYAFSVTNTGSTTLTDVAVDDSLLGVSGIRCGGGLLAPGARVDCPPVVYTLTQADIDAGEVVNTATATGRTPSGDPVTDDDSATVTPTGPSSVRLDKSVSEVVDVDGDGRADEGDRLTYTFVVTNTGATTLTDPVVTDPLLGLDGFACAPGELAPGASATCEAPQPYTLTAADVDAGVVDNTASVSADSASGAVTDDDSASAPLDRVAQVRIVKAAGDVVDANDSGRVDAGDTVSYTLRVENTSNVTLTDVAVSDPLLGTVTCPTTTLAAGATTTCTAAAYTLTTADLDAGRVDNTARVTATSPVSVVSDEDSVRVPLTGAASVSLTKTAGPVVDVDANGPDAGDTVTWTLEVTNTGTVSLDAVVVDDPLLGLTGFACGAGALAPGASRSCVPPTYVLTQEDVDAGAVTNTATVSGTPPTGDSVTDSDSATATLTPGGALTLDKEVVDLADTNDSGRDDAGDTVTYRFTVTNTGATSVADLVLDDARLGLVGVRCGDATLAPGASTGCERSYVLTQADVDAGRVDNEAAARGTDSRGAAVRAEDRATAVLDAAAGIELTKTASGVRDTNEDGRVSAGDEVEFAFSVRNTGDVTLRDVVVDDPRVGVDGLACAAGPLAPGDELACAATVTYVLTAADLDAGAVLNTATATATPTTGGTVTDDASAVVPLDRLAGLELTKTAGPVVDANRSGRSDAGDTVTYTFTLRNAGTTTLTGLAVDDPLLGAVTCPTGPLAAGASTTCTADPYVLTQADVDAGRVDNTATASATDPAGDPVSAVDTAVVEIDGAAGIGLEKSAGAVVDADDDGRQSPGDTVTYTFTVTNTGTTSLDDVTVDDARLGLADLACGTGPLAPGDERACTATYTLTQADLDAGRVDNIATASGSSGGPQGPRVAATDDVTVPLTGVASLSLVKTGTLVDEDGDGLATEGETIRYAFRVTNTGTVTLNDVAVSDPRLGGTVRCPAGPLAPGDSVDCDVLAYAVTAGDAAAGSIRNVAVATAVSDTAGVPDPAPSESTAVVEARPPSGVVLTKTARLLDEDGDGRADAGERIAYTFSVRNSGQNPLTDVRLTDPMLGLAGALCTAGPLAPGAEQDCASLTRTHIVTATEARSGEVVNRASVSAADPYDGVVSDSDTAVVTAAEGSATPPPAGGGGPLAQTGSELLRGLVLGLLLLLGGVVAVRVSRRRGAGADTEPRA